MERIQKRQGALCISFHFGCFSCPAFARLEQPCTTTNSLRCHCHGLPGQPSIFIHHVLSIYHMPTPSLSRLSYLSFLLSIHCYFFLHCNQPLFSVPILSFIQTSRDPAIIAAFFSFSPSVFFVFYSLSFPLVPSMELFLFVSVAWIIWLKATPYPVPIHNTTFTLEIGLASI